MNKKEQDILATIGRRDGMTVPEGFFESFAEKMAASLPENPEAEKPRILPRKTVWERIRPYTYLAAMFAGIWCMLKMFSLMFPAGGVDLSIDNNRILTDALSDENFVYEYFMDDISDREVIEGMYEDSISIDEMIPTDSLQEPVF